MNNNKGYDKLEKRLKSEELFMIYLGFILLFSVIIMTFFLKKYYISLLTMTETRYKRGFNLSTLLVAIIIIKCSRISVYAMPLFIKVVTVSLIILTMTLLTRAFLSLLKLTHTYPKIKGVPSFYIDNSLMIIMLFNLSMALF